jgi:lysophospholipase L1-like esterase
MTNDSKPEGMVDHLDSVGAGPTAEEVEFAKAAMRPGPMDPALLARAFDPARLAAREEVAVRRRMHDWAQLCQYRDANAALADSNVRAVFIGDSITELWAVADPQLFTGGIVGRGISGQTSPQILLRMMPDVISLKPKIVHILCGSNDIAGNTGPSTPQDFKNNILAMVAIAQAHALKIVLGSLPPTGGFAWAPHLCDPRPRLAELNAWARNLAIERGLIWADYHSVLQAADGSMRSEFTRDGVHPGAEGYAAMRPVAEAALDAAFPIGEGA